ncbi:hypothetical protein LSH36_115g13080 [Paralvinella palmiformis]|uniref:Phosphatidylinositol-glycan biosynthesis class X protein n=1 Tax=Paralvinella palmiformis TaxID=53620 RepID=A0AAD9K0D0_9ANNE|nr:hypothetical protein LSH36_115g13080 [Paralvinella palmiformis]
MLEFSMAPIIAAHNVANSIRILGLTALFILTLMWDTAVMSRKSDSLNSELYKQCFVKRTSVKVGFHRAFFLLHGVGVLARMAFSDTRDVTTIVILPEDLLKSSSEFNEKTVFIKEHIPPGMYVDLYQTKSAEDFGGPEVYSENDIDMEKPEHLSSPHNVQVFARLEKQGPYYHSSVTLPIHLRYHKPSAENSHEQIHLEAPEIYLMVSGDSLSDDQDYISGVCDSSAEKLCKWLKMSCIFEPEGGMLEFSVPVGQIDHVTIVASVTLSVTIFSTIFLAHSIVTKKQKLKKQQ